MWGVLLIVALVVLAFGLLPQWPHMDRFDSGWFPSGAAVLLGIVIAVLMLAGKI